MTRFRRWLSQSADIACWTVALLIALALNGILLIYNHAYPVDDH